MRQLDPYSKLLLLEALTPDKKTGSKTKRKKEGVGYGVGAPEKREVSPLNATPKQIWFGAEGEAMPSGTDINTQANWGFHKQWVNQVLSGFTAGTLLNMGIGILGGAGQALPGGVRNYGNNIINTISQKISNSPVLKGILGAVGSGVSPIVSTGLSVAEFKAKQKIRTMIAKEYLGAGVTSEDLDTGDALGNEVLDIYKGMIDVSKSKPKSDIGRFGYLGKFVADKLPQLANMGIDPLDFATNTFGADAALADFQNLASRPGKASRTAMGYYGRGKELGQY